MTGEGLPLKERRKISRFLDDLEAEFVVLIGSWARKSQSSETSDIDLLVGLPSGSRSPRSGRVQAICLSSQEVARRVSEGDDLAQWSLRFGVPLSGRKHWIRLKEQLLPDAPWPEPERKLKLASKELHYADELTAMGDLDAAQVELKAGLGHLARGLLLDRHVFPLSRPEVPDQLRENKMIKFASLLDSASSRPLSRAELTEFIKRGRALIEERAVSA